jgi:SanA protein
MRKSGSPEVRESVAEMEKNQIIKLKKNYGMRKIMKLSAVLISAFILLSFSCNWYVNYSSSNFIIEEIKNLPDNEYALLPGTSKFFSKNDKNTFYQARINSAFLLYKYRKVKKIIVSGTAEKFYNEPKQLRKDLMAIGIPDEIIICDTTGLHTLQSVNFLKSIKADSVTIISQYAHLQRAVFLARKAGIKAVGYIASDPVDENKRVMFREYLAKIKAVWDSWSI